MPDVNVHDKTFSPFITADLIQKRVAELGAAIDTDYAGKKPLLIGVLNGSVIFMADLLRHIKSACEIGFIRVSSYHGTESSGKVRNVMGINDDITGRDIIIVEDIVDTGDTAVYLIDEIKKKNPASIKFATILFKPTALRHAIKPDYIGFEIPPAFVVGYGLDYDGLGRNLADIYQLKS
ncbi:MAG: hypoxanthine phosphoribosyltransferase [Bacteroidetes bacterium]|nr:hypoxanthine phosphoribosyltransferase [Bacteroidota bacterium]MBL0098100.1 hypoxanthine phosphoribosyltransferase [Bacteroidota bacterium]